MQNMYGELIQIMRREGSAFNPPDVVLGTVKSLKPLTLYVGGAVLTVDIYAPPNLLDDTKLPKITHVSCADRGAASALSGQLGELRKFLEGYLKRERLAVGDKVVVKRINEYNIILSKVTEI